MRLLEGMASFGSGMRVFFSAFGKEKIGFIIANKRFVFQPMIANAFRFFANILFGKDFLNSVFFKMNRKPFAAFFKSNTYSIKTTSSYGTLLPGGADNVENDFNDRR